MTQSIKTSTRPQNGFGPPSQTDGWTNAKDNSTVERSKLSVILLDLDTIYMVLKHRSRTGSKRHYQLLAVVNDEIEDVTALVCKELNRPADKERQTLVMEGGIEENDWMPFHNTIDVVLL